MTAMCETWELPLLPPTCSWPGCDRPAEGRCIRHDSIPWPPPMRSRVTDLGIGRRTH